MKTLRENINELKHSKEAFHQRLLQLHAMTLADARNFFLSLFTGHGF